MFTDRQSHSLANRHVNSEEAAFRLAARRNKLIGLWAAARMGLTGADAEGYARQVVAADLDEPGDEDVIRKLVGDFSAHGLPERDAEIRAKLHEMEAEALRQLSN